MFPKRMQLCLLAFLVAFAGCSRKNTTPSAAQPHPKLSIRAQADETIRPDLSKTPADLKKVYDYIDQNIDDHVADFQHWIQQPSISNSGEGIPESAEMVKGMFDKLAVRLLASMT